MSVLFQNIETLMTLHPLAKEHRGFGIKEDDLGLLKNAWLYCEEGKILALGTGKTPDTIVKRAKKKRDLSSCFVMPGLVDSHTHTLFAGDRSHEFAQRLNGATYQEIAAAGGGIQSTMASTRKASDKDLIESTLNHIRSFQKLGVTTVEIKTGYGLSVEEELRLARLLKKIQDKTESHLVFTSLALHDRSPEHISIEDYIRAATKNLLPVLAKEKLVSYVDAFVETGYFVSESLDEFMQTAKQLGFGIRIHADEFTRSQGARSAARWGAASADHLQCADDEDAKALAKAGTVATLLPGTSLYTGLPFTDARKFLKAGCAVAIASDFNPGSCYFKNLAQLASLGALHCHFKTWEALAAVTYVPALSLGLGAKKGALCPTFDADFLVYSLKGPEAWLADMGQTAPKEVWVAGKMLTQS